MSKLLYSLSLSTNKIAGVGNAFQRDFLGSSHKVLFEESSHGIKYSPQSKNTGVNHEVYGAVEGLTLRCAAFLGFGLCGLCEQP